MELKRTMTLTRAIETLKSPLINDKNKDLHILFTFYEGIEGIGMVKRTFSLAHFTSPEYEDNTIGFKILEVGSGIVTHKNPNANPGCYNEECDGETCSDCCPHEFDSDEGGYCLYCDKHITD